MGNFNALQALETEHLQHACIALRAVAVDDDHRRVGLDAAALNAADADDADVGVVIQLADLHAEATLDIHIRRMHLLDDGLKQVVHVAVADIRIVAGIAVERRGIDYGKIELRFGRAQLVEQVESLIQHPMRPRPGPVDLVDNDDGMQAHGEGLLGHEPGLRHGAVDRIHQQQHRIHHRQHPFDLAAKVGMARGVHDIDVVIVPIDRRVLGQNGDAALLLQRVGIHDPLFHFLMRGKGAGLLQQLVHQGGLAVVDVGDDGDIAKFFDHEGGGLRIMANRALYGPNMTRPNRSPVRQRRAGGTACWLARRMIDSSGRRRRRRAHP